MIERLTNISRRINLVLHSNNSTAMDPEFLALKQKFGLVFKIDRSDGPQRKMDFYSTLKIYEGVGRPHWFIFKWFFAEHIGTK